MARLSSAALFCLFALLALVKATPVPESLVVKNESEKSTLTIEGRDGDDGVLEDIVSVIVDVGSDLYTVVKGMVGGCNSMAEIKAQFTKSTVAALQQKFPDKNVLIVHPAYTENLVNAKKVHYDLDLDCVFIVPGYDAFVFDSGDFELKGDRGFENWAFLGNYVWDPKSNGNSIHFDPIVRGMYLIILINFQGLTPTLNCITDSFSSHSPSATSATNAFADGAKPNQPGNYGRKLPCELLFNKQ
jgi:hypothetical protein